MCVRERERERASEKERERERERERKRESERDQATAERLFLFSSIVQCNAIPVQCKPLLRSTAGLVSYTWVARSRAGSQ